MRSLIGLLLTLLVFCAAPRHAAAERAFLKTYSTAEGLGHFAVNRVVPDLRGLIWLCTREGLSMFDGYAFTTFGVADGLPSGNVTDVLPLPRGGYWIGTIEGLVFFDPAAPPDRRFTLIPAPGDTRTADVSRIVADAAGAIWVGTAGGVFRVTGEGRGARLSRLDLGISDALNATAVHTLLADRAGNVWIASGPGIFVRRADGGLRSLTVADGLPRVTVPSMIEDRSGRIWVTTGAELWLLGTDSTGKPVVRGRYGERDRPELVDTHALLESSDGSLWLSTVKGLFRLEIPSASSGQAPGPAPRLTPVTGQGDRPIVAVASLAEDASGQLWAATGQNGAVRLTNGGFRLEGDGTGLSDGRAIIETADGTLAIVGARGNDLAIFCVGANGAAAASPGGDIGLPTWAWNQTLIYDSAGDYWVGSYRGLFRFRGARSCADLQGRRPDLHLDRRSGLESDIIIRAFEDSRGDLWIATVGHGERPDGLSRWERRTGRLHKYTDRDGLPTFERHFVSAIAEDRGGNVWLGFSSDAGIARYRGGRFEVFARASGVPPGQIRNLALDREGRLWIASLRWGVLRVDDPTATTVRFQGYTTKDGLASNETHAIVPANDGRIYIASARGVDRFDPATGLVRHYSAADGVPPAEFRAALQDRSGVLWFTTAAGLLRFNPTVERPTPQPRVLITRVAINGEPHPVPLTGAAQVPPFDLRADQNSILVEFAAPGSASAADFAYRYRLEPGAAGWTPFTQNRSLALVNLAPGAYRLHIEARNAEGQTANTPATLAFTIVPPIWQRQWFVALVLVAIAGVAYGLHRYRLARAMEITRVRDRIAADLHDDLGANLTKIAVLGEVARQQSSRREAALASVAGIARESVSNMSDIVWAIDPSHDTLEDLVRKMRQHASETFSLGDVELTFSAPRHLERRHAGIEFRHDLFLLFKEAVNNAARHARCRRVDIDLQLTRGSLVLTVADDGTGFVPEERGAGHGLTSMRRRAQRMGGTLDIDAAPGRGTRIVLALSLEARARYSFG